MPSNVLIIDSSQNRGLVALSSGEQILASQVGSVSVSHSESLMPIIDQVVRDVVWPSGSRGIAGVQGIAVGVGPGSFTGIRIGLATAKGLALALGLPVLGFSSLRALSYAATPDGSAVGALNAYQGEVFAGWNSSSGAWNEAALSIDLLVDRLKSDSFTLDGIKVCGTAAAVFRAPLLAAGIRPENLIAEPNPLEFARGALLAQRSGQNAWGSASSLTANYLRSSQAEINANLAK